MDLEQVPQQDTPELELTRAMGPPQAAALRTLRLVMNREYGPRFRV